MPSLGASLRRAATEGSAHGGLFPRTGERRRTAERPAVDESGADEGCPGGRERQFPPGPQARPHDSVHNRACGSCPTRPNRQEATVALPMRRLLGGSADSLGETGQVDARSGHCHPGKSQDVRGRARPAHSAARLRCRGDVRDTVEDGQRMGLRPVEHRAHESSAGPGAASAGGTSNTWRGETARLVLPSPRPRTTSARSCCGLP